MTIATKGKMMSRMITALVVVALVGVMADMTSAAITARKFSAGFTNLNFEGNAVPTGAGIVLDEGATAGLEGWTVDGMGNYVIVQGGENNMAGNNGQFSAATGWTVEWRMKLDANDLPTPFNAGNRGAFNLHLADDSATAGHFQIPTMGFNSDTDEFVVWDAATDALIHQGGAHLEFHTVRLAVEGTGGDNEINMYVDDVFVGSPAGTAAALNRQWFGEEGAAVSSGTAIVDYFRFDTSGAFAPGVVPEPATMGLLGMSSLMMLRRSRRSA